jgi:NADH-quinone oxidoreductase subunit L
LLTGSWLSLLAAVLGISLAACFYWFKVFSAEKMAKQFEPIYLLLKNKYYFDEMYGWFVQKIVFGIASIFQWFDEEVVDDGMVDGSGWVTRQAGSLLRLTQTGQVQNYALVIFGSIAMIYLLMSF